MWAISHERRHGRRRPAHGNWGRVNSEIGKGASPMANGVSRDIGRHVERGRTGSAASDRLESTPSAATLPRNIPPIRLLRLAQVIECTGIRKTKLYEMQSQGKFPMRVKITEHAVGWVENDVQAWLANRVAQSDPLRTK